MLLWTCKDRQKSLSVGLRLHELMRYYSPILASPEYFLVAWSYYRDKWKWVKVRRSTWSCVFGISKYGHAADVWDREHTASAVENWKPHEKTQQLFLHLHCKQKLSTGSLLTLLEKEFSLSKGHFIFPLKICLFRILPICLNKKPVKSEYSLLVC